jgi:hypothetical protein
MIEIFLGIFPGSVFVYRYAPRLEFAKIVGFVLMEILPYIVIALLNEISLLAVLIGFLVVYSIYEIGYIQNDFAARKETLGRTDRTQFDKFRFGLFMLVRIPVIILCVYWAVQNTPHAVKPLIMAFAMLIIFFVHNHLIEPRSRILTFIFLNVTKISIRIVFISPMLLFYLFSAVPHLTIKVIHYLAAKRIVQVSESLIRSISVPVYGGFLLAMIIIDWKLCIVCFPYFLNHCKQNIVNAFKRGAGSTARDSSDDRR